MAEKMQWDIAQLVENTDPDWITGKLEEMVETANRLAEE